MTVWIYNTWISGAYVKLEINDKFFHNLRFWTELKPYYGGGGRK